MGITETNRSLATAVRQRRREMSITQAELAERVGCQQSAISMFEAGRTCAVAKKTIESIARALELDSADVDALAETGVLSVRVLKYCPVDACPSNIPYVVGGNIYYQPSVCRAREEQRSRCTSCGEIMQDACPNSDCAAPLVEGACCPLCGTAYVTATILPPEDAETWAVQQRARIRDIRELSHPVSSQQ